MHLLKVDPVAAALPLFQDLRTAPLPPDAAVSGNPRTENRLCFRQGAMPVRAKARF
jgi:hypothetical protein